MQVGLGIRPELFDSVFEQSPALGFFEAHSENYFGDSIARAKLLELRQNYPISLHGVGLSLGRADSLDESHLLELKLLADQVDPQYVSEHLAWSAYAHRHLPDLLPLPLIEQSFVIMCEHVSRMQDVLQRQVFVENPSNYLLFDQLQIPEPEFLNSLADATGCGLLVDVNNIFVSSQNLGRDAKQYLRQLNSKHVAQYHLAGHTEVDYLGEPVLIDSHNQKVVPEVWELYADAIKALGSHPTLFEWDSDFPELDVLLIECEKASEILKHSSPNKSQITEKPVNPDPIVVSTQQVDDKSTAGKLIDIQLGRAQQNFLDQLIGLDDVLTPAVEAHKKRLWVYQNNVFAATREYLEEVYPAVLGVVGEKFFKQMAQMFVQKHPPSFGNVYRFGEQFGAVLEEFDGLSQMPYLHDLIDYEWQLHDSYFATLEHCLDPNGLDQAQLLGMPVEFNPSAAVLRSEFPIYEIHRQSLPDFSGEVAIDLGQSSDSILVYKEHHAVKSRLLSEEEDIFMTALHNSENILQAIEALGGSLSPEVLSANLALTFELRLLAEKI